MKKLKDKRCPACGHVMSKHEKFCGATRCLSGKCKCVLTEAYLAGRQRKALRAAEKRRK